MWLVGEFILDILTILKKGGKNEVLQYHIAIGFVSIGLYCSTNMAWDQKNPIPQCGQDFTFPSHNLFMHSRIGNL